MITALLLSAALVELGVAVRNGPLALDTATIGNLRAVGDGPLGPLLGGLSNVASLAIWDAMVVAVGGLLWLSARRLDAVRLESGLALGEVATFLVKALVEGPRPAADAMLDLIATASFPSGHVVRVVVTLGLLLCIAWPRPALRLPRLSRRPVSGCSWAGPRGVGRALAERRPGRLPAGAHGSRTRRGRLAAPRASDGAGTRGRSKRWGRRRVSIATALVLAAVIGIIAALVARLGP